MFLLILTYNLHTTVCTLNYLIAEFSIRVIVIAAGSDELKVVAVDRRRYPAVLAQKTELMYTIMYSFQNLAPLWGGLYRYHSVDRIGN